MKIEHRSLRLPEVMELTGLSKTTIYRLKAIGRFPNNVQLESNCVTWISPEIYQFIEEKIKVT
tara:strand:- start:206 stop:394 length:189 start_codon:yes stop_codon:yes gene_type:complete